jgi:hypothetical protein
MGSRFLIMIFVGALVSVGPLSILSHAKAEYVTTVVNSTGAAARGNGMKSNFSHEPTRLSPEVKKQWYETGLWQNIGSFAAVLLTNIVAVLVVYLASHRAFSAMLKQRKIDQLNASLNEFYNPLYALLSSNRLIFQKTGPFSWPEDHIEREAAARVWQETKSKILANNQAIESLLRTKTHLIADYDSLDNYSGLLVHVAMYEAFQKVGTDLYRSFLFPTDIPAHVEAVRAKVIKEYKAIAKGTK